MKLNIVQADYYNPTHAEHIVYLTNAYAEDEMGGGQSLSAHVKEHLVEGLKATSNSMVLIAYNNDEPVGIVNCFWAYSTFYAKPLVNIHDLAVIESARGQGVGAALIQEVKRRAIDRGACKVTLEVLENNAARRLYEREGFSYGKPPYYFMSMKLDE
jgi:GNAT superfamily N-acetyltransferase